MRFRTLTEKSKMGFGKNHDLTVKSLLATNQNDYLRWVYYNCSHISFMPNILDILCITDDFRITKPGIDSNRFLMLQDDLNQLFRAQLKPLTQDEVYKNAAMKNKEKKINKIHSDVTERMFTPKRSSMARFNRGHKNDFNR